MPILTHSTYKSPSLLATGHLQTFLPGLIRRVNGVAYRRERIRTPDDDFLDLDWVKTCSRRVGGLAHRLEGDAQRHYMMGMAKGLAERGWDAGGLEARCGRGGPYWV